MNAICGANKQKKKEQHIQNSFSLFPHMLENNCIILMSLKPCTKNMKFMAPGSGVKALW